MRHLTFCGKHCGACTVDRHAQWSAFCRVWFELGVQARIDDWGIL